MFRRLATAAVLSIALAASGFAADNKPHRVAIQVNQNDPQVMNLALNNATIVPSGVVRIMELQEQGWSYVRP
jgi:intracellular sulfur oxidation DsrE/DsrF family protein